MSNTIDTNGRYREVGTSAASKKGGAVKVNGDASKAAVAESISGDKAHLSGRHIAVETAIANTPDVNVERVEQIKLAIAEGRFPVDPERIAQKFVELEGLLSKDE